MTANHQILYVPGREIDKGRWDNCMFNSDNGLIYGCSFYLDHITDNWDGLVLNDYEAVMPLPWRKKWGINYIYHPFATAQLGLFGNNINADLLYSFLATIPSKFGYWDYPLNYENLFQINSFPLYKRVNYILSLKDQYKELYNGYKENIRRNIKKCKKYGCSFATKINIEDILLLAKNTSLIADKDAKKFSALFHFLKDKEIAQTYGIVSHKNELLASCVFFIWRERAYYILVGNHPNGRTMGASHALIDQFIQDHAGENLVLDFEGSDIRNLAFFYSSFGAKQENYSAIRYNRLPWWLKWKK